MQLGNFWFGQEQFDRKLILRFQAETKQPPCPLGQFQ